MSYVARMELLFRRDDLSGAGTRALVAQHLGGMRASSPPEAVFALDLSGLLAPDVQLWSVWEARDEREILAGMGALRTLGPKDGEIKSMRVAEPFLGKGVGRAMLDHLIRCARAQGMKQLWLETGSGPAFDAARSLYQRAGFVVCGPFGDYAPSDFNIFMTRRV